MTPDKITSDHLISRSESLLVVIDAQERLLPVIAEREAVVENLVRLVKFARIIELPVVVTEQEKLGQTVPEIRAELAGEEPIQKATFDCFGSTQFRERLAKLGRRVLILAGVEAHICIAQTAIGGLGRYHVHVVSDAVSSRTLANRLVALERMARAGAIITSTEMVIYELLARAGTDEFKEALKLVK